MYIGYNERIIYRKYLLGLQKTRKLLNTTSNINNIGSIVNFTTDFISNYTNKNETVARHIIMGNIVLDVSAVKEIHIYTKKDKLIIELDQKKPDPISNINSIETLVNSVSLLAKILNIN